MQEVDALPTRESQVLVEGKDHTESKIGREQRRSAKILVWSAVLGVSVVLFFVTGMFGSEAGGNLGLSGKMLDYTLFFIMLFVLSRYLTTTAAIVVFASVAAFHYFEKIHYRDRPPTGLQGLHGRYFLLMFMGCLATLHVLALLKQQNRDEEE